MSMKMYFRYFGVGNKCYCVSAALFVILFVLTVQYLSILIANWTSDTYGWTNAETPGEDSTL